jgi:SAM-dependent methyltransferase
VRRVCLFEDFSNAVTKACLVAAAVGHEVHLMRSLQEELANFAAFGEQTRCYEREAGGCLLPYFENEFWTSKQRAGHRLHEISYRACFKPQLPRFFVERLTEPEDLVYDPFMGRGTTLLEAALLGRKVAGCDISPLAAMLCQPRLQPPLQRDVEARLEEISLEGFSLLDEELLVFYHPETLRELQGLRGYFQERGSSRDEVDHWIAMVATNRLTGHSPGFFSVYTLPPNQATSLVAQRRINTKRQQTPPYRDVKAIIAKKSGSLLATITEEERKGLREVGERACFLTGSADETAKLADGSVSLVVTSPPFLDVVDYKGDNWLRCWFNDIDAERVSIWNHRRPEAWQAAMERVFRELERVLKPGGSVAFEVGEVRKGTILLEDLVVPAGRAAGLSPELVLVNRQEFTKTANCWGVENLARGTNSNRIVLFRKKKTGD